METLQELREKWEPQETHKSILEIPRTYPGPELYVIIVDRDCNIYSLIHYFKVGDDWHNSVEISDTKDIFYCLEYLDGQFSDMIPA